MPESTQSPLARLVLYRVRLSVAGRLVVGVHYSAVDLPLQTTIQAPQNSNSNSYSARCHACMNNCNYLTEYEKYPYQSDCKLIG